VSRTKDQASRDATGPGADRSRRRGLPVSPKVLWALAIILAALWFILVNRQRVAIFLWVPKITAPMWVVLLITFAAGLITGMLLMRSRKPR
jgi:uncharacterized integral membrane protein